MRPTLLLLLVCVFTAGSARAEEIPPIRAAILRSAEVLRTQERAYPDRFRAVRSGDDRAALEEELVELQKSVALTEYRLAELLSDLETLEKERGQETRRWQAAYDCTVARVQIRVAFLREYNTVLARLRKDDMPEFDPDRHQGWHLVPREDPSLRDREAEVLSRKARVLLEHVISEHKGTPWELLSRRELVGISGLEWRPVPK